MLRGMVTTQAEVTLFAEEGTVVTTARLVIGEAAIAIGYVKAVVPHVERPNRARPLAVAIAGALGILAAVHPELRERFADLTDAPGVLLGAATLALGVVMLVLARSRHTVWVTTAHGQQVRALVTRSRARAERLSHAVVMAMSSRPLPTRADAGVHVVERQVVVSRCRFCSALAPVDTALCPSCGSVR
jgi:hypothetical protein